MLRELKRNSTSTPIPKLPVGYEGAAGFAGLFAFLAHYREGRGLLGRSFLQEARIEEGGGGGGAGGGAGFRAIVVGVYLT